MNGVVQISKGSENSLLAAVACTGPVSVAVDGDSNAFRVRFSVLLPINTGINCFNTCSQFYYQGVYDSSRCSSSSINHAMVVTGYGVSNGKDYWLVKNRYKHLHQSLICQPPNITFFLFIHSLASLLQLGHQLGHEWLHPHDQGSVQPVWHCHRCLLPYTLVFNMFTASSVCASVSTN